MTHVLIVLSLLAGTAEAPATPTPAPAMVFKDGLATPESVLYDATSDSYLVSNINGSPLDKDNNGYITELSPDGGVRSAKLIEGGKSGVTLHAPKGSAVHNGTLYVADIDVVRLFDRKSGAPKGEIKIEGATFLNDVAVGPDGSLYVSDSGLSPKFESTGTDAVWVMRPGANGFTALAKSKDMKGPNGLLVTADAVFVVPFGGNTLQAYDAKGNAKGAAVALPNGGLDGVVATASGDLLVSSWGGKAIYRGKPAGPFAELVTNVEAPADVGYDTKRGRLLVPRFQGNAVEVYEVK